MCIRDRGRIEYHIQQQDQNFTELADLFNFSSIHYFSKFYKRETGRTLREYLKNSQEWSCWNSKSLPLYWYCLLYTSDIRNGNGRAIKSKLWSPNRVDKIDAPVNAIFWIMKDPTIPPVVKLKGAAPVSYTHLDVYKRQIISSCSSARSRRGRYCFLFVVTFFISIIKNSFILLLLHVHYYIACLLYTSSLHCGGDCKHCGGHCH